MSNLSKDQKVKNSIKHINAMETVEAVHEYIAGEDRQDVLDAAQLQIEMIEKTAPHPSPSPLEGEGKRERGALSSNEHIPAAEQPGAGASPELKPIDERDGTPGWVKTLHNLQPKAGEVSELTKKIESAGLKATVVQKEAVRKVLTIQDGVPHWIYFDEDGKKIKSEKVPGH